MPVDLANPDRVLNVGVILVGGVTEILDVAPIDLLNAMSASFLSNLPVPDDLKAQAVPFAFHWVTEKGDPANLTSGITIQATHSFANCPNLDIVLMGAHNSSYNLNEAEKAFVRQTFYESAAFLSVCGGVRALLEAGVLEGRKVTAPRFSVAGLRRDFPGTEWVERRWVRDGTLWSSGTLLNGLDLMRAFAEETWGGRGTLVRELLEFLSWPPGRSVEYRDDRPL